MPKGYNKDGTHNGFKKGYHPPPRSPEWKEKQRKFKMGNKNLLGFKFSEASKKKMSDSHKGYKMPESQKIKIGEAIKRHYKLNNYHRISVWPINKEASYSAIHHWLINNFGKAKQCEHCGKMAEDFKTKNGQISKRHPIQYALIKGKKHSHKRYNYLCLCYKCHGEYDSKS